jgi:putative NIF3 family GTP cyclohydrolase 1 type 2
MNDALAEALGLKDIYSPMKDMMMRIGTLDRPMDVASFAIFAKERLCVDYGLLINEGSKEIRKVGIIGGGGSRSWKIAKEEGCDLYISGDAPHHVRREIVNAHFNYLDLPHEIEKIFMPTMKEILLELDPSLEIKTVDHEKLPKVIQ